MLNAIQCLTPVKIIHGYYEFHYMKMIGIDELSYRKRLFSWRCQDRVGGVPAEWTLLIPSPNRLENPVVLGETSLYRLGTTINFTMFCHVT